MSDTGLFGSDLKRLRHLGSLVDTVLVTAADSGGGTFRSACDALREALSAATASPVQSIQGLYLSELLEPHLNASSDAWRVVLSDLGRYAVHSNSLAQLERLAAALEKERVRAATRMQSVP